MKQTVLCTVKRYLCFPAPGPNLFLTAPALNLYLLASALNSCLPVLRFTVKVCYSYNVYLDKLSVYLYLLRLMWATSKLKLFEIYSQEIFSILLIWL